MIGISSKRIKRALLRFQFFKFLRKKMGRSNMDLLSGDDKRLLDRMDPVIMEWPDGWKRPKIGLVKDFPREKTVPYTAYWPKYERFLKNNSIPYEIYNIHTSDWLKESNRFDMIIWRVNSDPISMDEAREKIFALEVYKGKDCFPSLNEIWSNEDKVKASYLLSMKEIPTPETFISYDLEEIKEYLKKCNYPIVTKIRTGSGSKGVELLRSRKEALSFVDEVFNGGRNTYWPHQKQIGYVYFQEFIKDSLYDLRVIVLKDKFFGYRRYPKEGDFRASGAGNMVHGPIPEEALRIAERTRDALDKRIIAVDLIKDRKRGFLVNEVSCFFRVDDGIELEIDGFSGYYQKVCAEFSFIKANHWIQELTLCEILSDRNVHGTENTIIRRCLK
ncbi:MAG: hypothetical protein QCI82_02105 [Candidatus Thermoplasmatota archaeon]|nr:hypothetical protein [Candidatus Thermoplasmatota archaeon]